MSDPKPRPTVLVVDDQALVRMNAVAILEESGFDTIEAASAAAAIGILQDQADRVTMLFTDIEMPPGADGIDLAREVHERWPHILLLVTSGRVEVNEDDLPDDGRFLAKPYPAPAVVNKLKELIVANPGRAEPPDAKGAA